MVRGSAVLASICASIELQLNALCNIYIHQITCFVPFKRKAVGADSVSFIITRFRVRVFTAWFITVTFKTLYTTFWNMLCKQMYYLIRMIVLCMRLEAIYSKSQLAGLTTTTINNFVFLCEVPFHSVLSAINSCFKYTIVIFTNLSVLEVVKLCLLTCL